MKRRSRRTRSGWGGPLLRRDEAGARGTTFVELIVTSLVLGILAGAALPVAAVARRRQVEIELRRALREIRLGLDAYHEACLGSVVQPGRSNQNQQAGARATPAVTIKIEDDPNRTCWPKELEVLVEGVETSVPKYELKFLRRIPRDPTNVDDRDHDDFGWNLRSSTDDPDGNISWDRENVFDVRSASDWQALDGSFYRDW
ncbi:MAG: type II secretion system protein [Acidobacteriota bacterium]